MLQEGRNVVSKGSKCRPKDIDEQEFDERWNFAFKRREKNGEMKRKPKKYEPKNNS